MVLVKETGKFKDVAADQSNVSTIFIGGKVRQMIHDNNKQHAVYEWVMFQDGRAAEFYRLANVDNNGLVDLAQFQVGDFVVRPGIVYRTCEPTTEMMQKFIHKVEKIKASNELKTRGTNLASKGIYLPKKYRH